ncbi:hypothetical protein H072_5674 [Dactylellina haptotyla CBS 200.50]|uniref:Uncharacterized protein n=1 Tax=Dactylellina haptotyla (strain CBS 200.50) TaxID=1284197 RepID=S8BYQ5_DACHA|nr:hypothetical protein H072_5674 [Dactylellina haptotyla CBS 200.50]
MPAETPPYSSSHRTNSTGDDMTLTNTSNPLASVAPSSTTRSDSHDHIQASTSTVPTSAALTATSSTEKSLKPPPAAALSSDNGTPQNEPKPAPMLSERKSSILRPPLPPLPFHLRGHKGAVTFVFIVMVIDHGLFPPAAYFGLKYATNISLTTIFGIITGIFGVVLGLECFIRSIKLLLPSRNFQPLGQTNRFGMDFWQFSFTLCLIINVVCVSVGTALNPPFLNLMAMPMPTVIFNLSWQLLLSDFLHERKVRTPFRISSTPKGEIWPRFIYVIIEDVIAVDCNGKREWRQAWRDRVAASKPMRETLKRLSFFWGVGGICISALCFGLLWGFDSVSGKEAGYALGWLLPWAWIIPSTVFTTFYVKKRLKDERHFVQRYKGSFSV